MTLGTLGPDNIAVAFALGPLGLGWRRIGLLGVIFGVAEAGMALLGATAGGFIGPVAVTATEAAHVCALATIAVALIGLVWIKCRPADIVVNPWALLVMSLLLGIDNFIAGRLNDQTPAFASLVTEGILTGTLSAAACAVGSALLPLTPRTGAMVSSLMLAGLAIAGMA